MRITGLYRGPVDPAGVPIPAGRGPQVTERLGGEQQLLRTPSSVGFYDIQSPLVDFEIGEVWLTVPAGHQFRCLTLYKPPSASSTYIFAMTPHGIDTKRITLTNVTTSAHSVAMLGSIVLPAGWTLRSNASANPADASLRVSLLYLDEIVA